MRIAGLAAGLFLAGFLVHWILWRIRIPLRQTAAILLILLATLPVGLAAGIFLPPLKILGPLGFWECLHISIFHVAMALAYAVCNSALEERSPSMTLLTFVADARGQGRTREELEAILRSASPVEVRLKAMVRDRLATEAEGVYRLTPKGRAWVRIFLFWRRLLKMEKGG